MVTNDTAYARTKSYIYHTWNSLEDGNPAYLEKKDALEP